MRRTPVYISTRGASGGGDDVWAGAGAAAPSPPSRRARARPDRRPRGARTRHPPYASGAPASAPGPDGLRVMPVVSTLRRRRLKCFRDRGGSSEGGKGSAQFPVCPVESRFRVPDLGGGRNTLKSATA